MNYKKIAFFIMTIGFVMIMSGSVSSFIIGLQRDREETYKRISIVNDEFEEFSTKTTIFENFRDELYTGVLGNVYYDTMSKDDKKIKEKLSNYENIVDDMSKSVKELDKLCEDVYYPDSKTNSKCSNYKSIYEQVNNYFVSDIKIFNKNVSKYNDYQKSQKSNLNVKPYSTNKKYIDFNEDGKYDGKEE